MRQTYFIISIFLLACNANQPTKKETDKADTTAIATNKMASVDNQMEDTAKTEIIETFVDSVNVGEKGKCKIELIKHRVYDDNFIIIKFYIKGRHTTQTPETWMNTNTYSYETNAMMGFQPNISDFNNDNFNDISFISGTAARGANEIRRLFIYDKQAKYLILIVNAQDYPNMLYNKELNCIDAFLVHGGCSTVFLNIEGDSLKEFASVELVDSLIITTYDKRGKPKIKKQSITNEAPYTRYKNFNPLKEYSND